MATRQRPPRVWADRDHWYSPARALRALLHNGPRATSAAVRVLAATALAAASLTVVHGSAAAEPEEDLDTVQKKVAKLGETVEKTAENYNQAKIKLTATKKRVASLKKQVGDQQAEVERLREKVGAMAAAAYIRGPANVANLATAQTPQDLVDRAATLQQLSLQDKMRLDKYTKANRTLKAKRENAAEAMSEAKALTKKLKSKKTSITETLAEKKELLQRLTAAGRTDERADRSDRPNVDLPPASGKVGDVIAFAEAQLGKPYQWGGDGPGSYDCSGLTMRAWQQGGVSLPHSSQAQQSSGPAVSRGQLQPGDLVFFGNPVHHVGLYVGGGQMIHAPNSGEQVQYSSINESYYRSNWAGAVRPG